MQDYHFALLPAMIKAKLPQATIITFWHIPWPNPESFGICPWRRELLMGMLGSTILGFHTRYHCKNFIETVDRYLEARIEHEHSTIISGGVETLIESYPISIEWPDAATTASWLPVAQCRANVIERHKLPQDACIAVGVDRLTTPRDPRASTPSSGCRKVAAWSALVFVQVAAPPFVGGTSSAVQTHQRALSVYSASAARVQAGAHAGQPRHRRGDEGSGRRNLLVTSLHEA